MPYKPLKVIGEALADVLRESGRFKDVLYTQATNGDQVWSVLQAMGKVPVAAVAIGTVNYDRHGLKRQIQPMIFLLGPFMRGAEAEAAGIWEMAEGTAELFLAKECDQGLDFPEAAEIEFTPISITPIPSPGSLSASCLTLSGVDYLTGNPRDCNEEEDKWQ